LLSSIQIDDMQPPGAEIGVLLCQNYGIDVVTSLTIEIALQ
jgi:hypothetical protein